MREKEKLEHVVSMSPALQKSYQGAERRLHLTKNLRGKRWSLMPPNCSREDKEQDCNLCTRRSARHLTYSFLPHESAQSLLPAIVDTATTAQSSLHCFFLLGERAW